MDLGDYSGLFWFILVCPSIKLAAAKYCGSGVKPPKSITLLYVASICMLMWQKLPTLPEHTSTPTVF